MGINSDISDDEIFSHNWNGDGWESVIFNLIAQKRNFTKYLELGIGDGGTLKNVSIKEKTAVDIVLDPCVGAPTQCEIFLGTTHDFFKSLKPDQSFDLIFIDADHDKGQVVKDFINSFNHLSDKGIIAFQDVCPLHLYLPYLPYLVCAAEGRGHPTPADYELWMRLTEHFKKATLTAGTKKKYGTRSPNTVVTAPNASVTYQVGCEKERDTLNFFFKEKIPHRSFDEFIVNTVEQVDFLRDKNE